MQGLVADATAAATTAEAFADQLTTTELIASSATFAPNTNITTKGYTTSGDGGSGSWIQNGVTGQTVSQSPAQLGNALLNDAGGNQWALVADFSVNVRWLGAVLDGVTDDTNNFLAAIAFSESQGGIEVFFDGSTLVTETLVLNHNVALTGSSPSRTTGTRGSAIITADHSNGPVVRIRGENVNVSNVVLLGSSKRKSGVAGDNYGLLAEAPDVAGGDGEIRGFRLDSVYVNNMPNHGIVTSGYIFMGLLEQCAVRSCFGHAFMFDTGLETSRVNKARVGSIVLRQPKGYANSGHHVVFGSGDLDYGGFRFEMYNSDGARGGVELDPAIKYGDASVYIKGENILTMNCAFDGDIDGVNPVYKAMILNGRVMRHVANRYIKTTGIAHIEQNGSFDSTDIEFDGCQFGSTSTNNPAITTEVGVGRVKLVAPFDSQITAPFDSNLTTPIYESDTTLEMGDTNVSVKKIGISPDSLDGVSITRADGATGIDLVRTGSGAVSTRIDTDAGKMNLGTTTDSDVIIKRNSAVVVTFNSSAMNINLLPTSSAGLSAGDVWNNSGVLNVV